MNVPLADELKGLNLQDKRLEKRAVQVLESLAVDPQASINAACPTWAETQGAYRFFDNPKVTAAQLLAPHRQATLARCAKHAVILVPQDTTELDYTPHAPDDAQCLERPNRLGFYAHLSLACTPARLPLGVLDLAFFARDPDTLGRANERHHWPIEQKESYRWLLGYRLVDQLAHEYPEHTFVSIADREADIYDLFLEAETHRTPDEPKAHFIIRAKQDRRTPERAPEVGANAYRRVQDDVAASPVRLVKTLELAATPTREKRTATLEIRGVTVTIKAPHDRPHLPNVTLQVVWVREINGPTDGTAVSWWLLTSLPIDTVEQCVAVVDYYAARWCIEVFFRTWKTGCRVEDIQLETVARLQKSVTLYALIAWRIMYLTHTSRTTPEEPCTTQFTPLEWQWLWCRLLKEPLPKEVPSLSFMVRLLAQLGGYNNRKKDPPPGAQTIWRGLRRLYEALAFLDTAQPLPDQKE